MGSFTRTRAAHAELARVFSGGIVSTLAMNLIVYLGPFAGIPNVDFGAMLGALLSGGPPALLTKAWVAGIVWHFLNGIFLFPLLYAGLFAPFFSFRPLARGLAWGVTLWLFCQTVAMPLVGGGFFSRHTSDPGQVVLGSLLAHLVYGGTLGLTARRGRAPALPARWEEKRAA